MGICVPDKDTILLATLFQIITFKNVLEPEQQINGVLDACYVWHNLRVFSNPGRAPQTCGFGFLIFRGLPGRPRKNLRA